MGPKTECCETATSGRIIRGRHVDFGDCYLLVRAGGGLVPSSKRIGSLLICDTNLDGRIDRFVGLHMGTSLSLGLDDRLKWKTPK